MSNRVEVRVPASSANLGAGFDCIAVAVDRWLTLEAWLDERAQAPVFERTGTLAEHRVAPNDDLIVQAIDAACAAAGRPRPRGLHIRATSTIPVARGLGSSAAALVGGALVANSLLQLRKTDHQLVDICSTHEGHGDNVAAAMHGGATLILWPQPSYVARLTVSPSVAFALAVPSFPTTTTEARAVLPASIEYHTAVTALSRTAALIQGLATGDATLLGAALDDVMHVPYRRGLIRGFNEVTAAARTAGAYGATLSGSGSSLVAPAPVAKAHAVAEAMRRAWQEQGVEATSFVSPAVVPGASVHVQSDPE